MNNLKHLHDKSEINGNFTPMTEAEIKALLESTYEQAQDGKNEWYKYKEKEA